MKKAVSIESLKGKLGNLPTLNIPCGLKLKGSKENDVIRCGDMDFQGTLNDVPRKQLYCKNCDYQLFVVKAHAAAYNEEAKKFDMIRLSCLDNNAKIMDEEGYQEYVIKTHEEFAARDAVLKLIGRKTIEELEEKEND